ncbi:MAG: bifunctional demethylmenaquinone methyltransferase/2-methoxy-6-polyprenyl-1,4-benzoquinol methylase UbiE [Deltaproteobacteria bacterium]|nr:bifunctional demethylmenaquinone methyltransferase/2-methoxy-6-polyprenyl-1,4-benzoquinol methylase UbiE [Deltaproteobacteria bacterium]
MSGEEVRKTNFGYKEVDVTEKKGLVREVFDSVSGKYDLMNDLMSLGTHRLWKRFFVEKAGVRPGMRALDVAGGTADIALLMAAKAGETGSVVVYDINKDMLDAGRDKCLDRGVAAGVSFVQGDAEHMPFEDNSFDVATIAFGIRNVTHIDIALSEMARVVRPGGRVMVLEFSRVRAEMLSNLYDAYSFGVIPAVGERVTGNRDAYVYLAESIRKFPDQESFKAMMEDAGLFKVRYYNIFGGIAAVHSGVKV